MNSQEANKIIDKDKKSRCFSFNIYGHITKDYKRLKKERETRNFYKYKKWNILQRTVYQDRR